MSERDGSACYPSYWGLERVCVWGGADRGVKGSERTAGGRELIGWEVTGEGEKPSLPPPTLTHLLGSPQFLCDASPPPLT